MPRKLDSTSSSLLQNAIEKLQLSARAHDRILKMARTIADLAHSPAIQAKHLAEAITYRNLDRENWSG
jgi:magnesium chelatase family protein